MGIGEILVYLFGGGALVKLVEFLLRRYLDRGQLRENLHADERANLRKDVEYLRDQIDDLRREVEKLKAKLSEKDEEVNVWQRKYWGKKIILDRVLLVVENKAKQDIVDEVHHIVEGDD